MVILFEARILYQTLTKLVLTSPLLLIAVRALDFVAISSSCFASCFTSSSSFSSFLLSAASFSNISTGLRSFLLFIRAFEGGRDSRRVNKNGDPCVEQMKRVKGTKGGRVSSTTTTSLLLTRDTVVDLLLLGLNPTVPLSYLLVDTAAHPGCRDIFEVTRYSLVD